MSITACATFSPQAVRNTDGVDEIIDVLTESVDAMQSADSETEGAQLDPDLLGVLLPPPGRSGEDNIERFSLKVNKLPANEFFRGLVRDTQNNMVVHPDVKGQISLDLKNVSVDEVMEIMREVYGYDYVKLSDTYQVFPDVLRTQIFHVDYLNIKRSGFSEMQVSAGKVSDAGAGGNSNVDDNGEYFAAGADSAGVVGTSVSTSTESDFWSSIQATLSIIVGDAPGQRVVVTPQAGLIVVKAKPAALSAVKQYLQDTQEILHRSVIIEAKILEVTLKEGFQAGIDWHTFGDASGGAFSPVTTVDEFGNISITNGSEHSVAGEFLSGFPADLFNPLGSGFTLSSSFGDFEGAISLLETQGNVQVLSSPRISTINNQKAVIKVGNDEFFVTDIAVTTVTAGSAINTNDSPELTPFFSGIALDVTPQISAKGEVILHIHPTVSEVTEQLKRISGENVPLAASTIRESDSIVRAMDGQIVVIGGLMQNSSADHNAAVPALGKLPLFGHLFRQTQQKGVKSELVILLRPIVVTPGGHTKALGSSLERVNRLRARMGASE
ncbi:MAG: pilus (MSHA type) biogenesis protein MshL [Pseudomonadales bacterium]|nr:pilus (MSHA type) biogenesis protein MshL [Pseudomonadales bacterium]